MEDRRYQIMEKDGKKVEFVFYLGNISNFLWDVDQIKYDGKV